MKILYDCTELSYFYDTNGHRAGVFYVALNLLNELKKRGYDITFYCDFRRYYFMKNIREFSEFKILDSHSGFNKLIGWLLYQTRNFPYTIKTGFTILARFLDKYLYFLSKSGIKKIQEFDIYFSPFTPPSLDIQKAKIPKFRMLHDIIPILEKGMPKNTKDWHYKVYNTISENEFYVTNSQCTREDVLKYFPFIKPENIKTTLLGVNENFGVNDNFGVNETGSAVGYNIPQDKKYVFSLCTLGKRKNVIFAIRNFIKFIEKNKINDLVLVLGGSNWKTFETELDRTLKQYDKSKIILTGYVKDEDLPGLYSNALMFVYPSLYEGFGLPVLEAMKCGCPVITSNTSSLPEVIGNAGIKINPESDEEMIQAYEKFYYDNFFRELCSERGQIRAKDFTWARCADEIIDFIDAKLNQPDK